MSSSDIAIKAESVSKVYRLGVKDEMQDSLSNTIINFIKSPLKNFQKYRSLYNFDDVIDNSGQNNEAESSSILWALRDISLEVKQGEAIGFIGRNGAGKSTLLKIISRVTSPTKGRIEIHGKMASLLEVGTGFHKELTGRENIYLNATVLGMRKKEVDKKFDEIVEFSGIEKFIDTPIKRYSSGMTVRLAFSVAAHLEPEILIVDEVLAVGDASFQKKCLEKMEDVGKGGRTVLFVSHNLQAITRLCTRVILLENGKIIDDGPAASIVAKYSTSLTSSQLGCREWYNDSDRPGDDVVQLLAVRVKDQDGNLLDSLDIRKTVNLEMEFEVLQGGSKLLPHFHLLNETGVKIMSIVDLDPDWQDKIRPKGTYQTIVTIQGNFFSECTVFVHANLVSLDPVKMHFGAPDAVAFQVVDSQDGNSARGRWVGPMDSIVRPAFEWNTEYRPD